MLYQIQPGPVSLADRVPRACFIFLATLLAAIVIHRLWFAHRPLDWPATLIEAAIAAVIAFAFETRRKKIEIEVTDEEISTREGLSLAKRKVRRGYIQFWRESSGNMFRQPGLRLSEHGSIHAFFFGYVLIPASMPQYQQIKNKAMGWMSIS